MSDDMSDTKPCADLAVALEEITANSGMTLLRPDYYSNCDTAYEDGAAAAFEQAAEIARAALKTHEDCDCVRERDVKEVLG